jgi:hypothetical protein
MKAILRKQNSTVIYREVYPASILDVSAGNCQTALMYESVMIRDQMRTHDWSEMVAVKELPCAPTLQK